MHALALAWLAGGVKMMAGGRREDEGSDGSETCQTTRQMAACS